MGVRTPRFRTLPPSIDRSRAPSVTVFDLSAPVALAIGGGAVLVSLLAGVLPARRAARVEPAEALRTQ